MTGHRDADAFRTALEQRIRNASSTSGTPHDRLRKDVAFSRLVARFLAVNDDRWAIKGGVALLWRLGANVRGTRDVDANWWSTNEELLAFLDRAVEQRLDEWFEFEIGPPRAIEGEVEGGLRFGIACRLGGREFATFRLDVNFISDTRPVELVPVELPFLAFAGLDHLEVPMISVAQHLAEKLHAVARTYASGDSSRAKDAYDSVMLAQVGAVPDARSLRDSVTHTFRIRRTQLPTEAPSLPSSWTASLRSLLVDAAPLGVEDVEGLERGWFRFWQPILDGTADDSARWDPKTMFWTPIE